MNYNDTEERKARAINELVEAAEKWVAADGDWKKSINDGSPEEDAAYELMNHLRERLLLAAFDLVKFGGTR